MRFRWVLFLTILLAGCVPATSATPTATQTAVKTSSPTATITPGPSPTPTVTVTPTKIPLPELPPINESGPWLVYYSRSEQAYFAVNEDGSGKSRLLSVETNWPNFAGSIGNHLAIVTEWPELGDDYNRNLALVILQLPDGNVIDLIPLVGKNISAEDRSVGGNLTVESLDWSPDGRYLAFIGAMDGPTTDLYLYDIHTRSTSRIDTSVNRVAAPKWSPNGEWLVYNEHTIKGEMDDFLASWAISMVNGEVRKLFTGGPTAISVEWIGPESFISLAHPNGPPSFLYLVDLGNNIVAHPLPAESRILGLPYQLFGTNYKNIEIAYSANSHEPDTIGTYILSISNPTPKQITDEDFLMITWMPGINRYIAYPDVELCGLTTFTSDGDFSCLLNEELAFVEHNGEGFSLLLGDIIISPDGQWLILSDMNGNLYLYDEDIVLVQYIPESGFNSWRPDSKGFYFRDEDGLHYMSLESFEVQNCLNLLGYGPKIWNNDLSGFFSRYDDVLTYYSVANDEYQFIDTGLDEYARIITWVGKTKIEYY